MSVPIVGHSVIQPLCVRRWSNVLIRVATSTGMNPTCDAHHLVIEHQRTTGITVAQTNFGGICISAQMIVVDELSVERMTRPAVDVGQSGLVHELKLIWQWSFVLNYRNKHKVSILFSIYMFFSSILT